MKKCFCPYHVTYQLINIKKWLNVSLTLWRVIRAQKWSSPTKTLQMVPREKILTLCQFPDLLIEFTENRCIERLYFDLGESKYRLKFFWTSSKWSPAKVFCSLSMMSKLMKLRAWIMLKFLINLDFSCRPNIKQNVTDQLYTRVKLVPINSNRRFEPLFAYSGGPPLVVSLNAWWYP